MHPQPLENGKYSIAMISPASKSARKRLEIGRTRSREFAFTTCQEQKRALSSGLK